MISIQRAGLEDAEELLKIKINAFKEEKDLYGFGPPGYDLLDNQINAIKNRLYYKILDMDRIIGGMCICDMGGGFYWVGSIYIDLERQSEGIGSIAMNFLKDEFPHAKKWALETPYLSYRNHHFYEKLGFIKVGEKAQDPSNEAFCLFQYEKSC